MEIRSLVNRDYFSLSILEDMQQIAHWLQQQDYYAIVDEELKTVGIVTAQDFVRSQHNQLIDHNFEKPTVHPGQTIAEVLQLMKTSQSAYLPVYENQRFVGVISLWSLTDRLLQKIEKFNESSVSPGQNVE